MAVCPHPPSDPASPPFITSRMAAPPAAPLLAVLLLLAAPEVDASVEAGGSSIFPCAQVQASQQFPSYHLMNNLTRHSDGSLGLEWLNDANAIFQYKGVLHVMCQGGGSKTSSGAFVGWTHAVSEDMVRFRHLKPALVSNASSSWDSKMGPCDGTGESRFWQHLLCFWSGLLPVSLSQCCSHRDVPPVPVADGALPCLVGGPFLARDAFCCPLFHYCSVLSRSWARSVQRLRTRASTSFWTMSHIFLSPPVPPPPAPKACSFLGGLADGTLIGACDPMW